MSTSVFLVSLHSTRCSIEGENDRGAECPHGFHDDVYVMQHLAEIIRLPREEGTDDTGEAITIVWKRKPGSRCGHAWVH